MFCVKNWNIGWSEFCFVRTIPTEVDPLLFRFWFTSLCYWSRKLLLPYQSIWCKAKTKIQAKVVCKRSCCRKQDSFPFKCMGHFYFKPYWNCTEWGACLYSQVYGKMFVEHAEDSIRVLMRSLISLWKSVYLSMRSYCNSDDPLSFRIDANVEETELNVEAAHGELLKYFQSVTSNRWLIIKIFCVLIIFFVVFVVFMAWIFLELELSNSPISLYYFTEMSSILLGNTLYLLVKVGLFDAHKWKFQNMKGGADTGVCLAGNLWFTMATVTGMPN